MASAQYGNERCTCKRGPRALYAQECGYCGKEQMEEKLRMALQNFHGMHEVNTAVYLASGEGSWGEV